MVFIYFKGMLMRKLGNSPLKLLLAMCFSVAFLLPASVYADFQEGWAAYENGDYATAFAEWEPLAEQGGAVAQYNLGSIYDNGQGVLQDDSEAVKWYRLAAEQGVAQAQSNLGVMYRNGRGVLQDYSEAVKWNRLAAEQGVAQAQSNLGVMYDNGRGVLQDYAYAHMWFNIAAANGDAIAGENRQIVADLMTPSQIEQAQEMARNCLNSGYVDCGD